MIKEDFHNFCEGKSIVVLGNSSKLLELENGEFYDSHDIVLRMNWVRPSEDTHKYLGKKTDIWSVNRCRTLHNVYTEYYQHHTQYVITPFPTPQPFYSKHTKSFFIFPFSHFFKVLKLFNPNKKVDKAKCYREMVLGTKIRPKGGIATPTSGSLILSYFLWHINLKRLTVAGIDFFSNSTIWWDDKSKYGSELNQQVADCHSPSREEKFITGLLENDSRVSWIRHGK